MSDFNVLIRFCLAHLIRDVKFLANHPNAKNRRYGARILESPRDMFQVIHRRETMTPAGFERGLKRTGPQENGASRERGLKETGQDLFWQATRHVLSSHACIGWEASVLRSR